MGKCINLIGQQFGRLTVIERADNYVAPCGTKSSRWLCECNCKDSDKNKIIVNGHSLRNGHTRSCGCLRKEVTSTNHKKYNKYDLSGDYGIGYTSKGEEFLFDLNDYLLIKDYCWRIDKSGYVVTRDIKRKIISFHRLLLPHLQQIDHKNNNKYDNRRCNLRFATVSQNNMNRPKKANNTSGVTGVNWHKSKEQWRAFIVINKKHIHLGLFTNFEDAVKARKTAEEKYFGEFSYANSIKDLIECMEPTNSKYLKEVI